MKALFGILLIAMAISLGCKQDCADCTGCFLPVEYQTQIAWDSVAVAPPETTRVAGRLTIDGCYYDVDHQPVEFHVENPAIGAVNGVDSVAYDTTTSDGELDFTYLVWAAGCNVIRIQRWEFVMDSVTICGE